ncbi:MULTISPECIES: aspartate aminotransferase family protein [unclassified Colwellia]|uniref:aspartate aminotransferase family protein n=1 Tax=unclassified Colwellia TaxID=196834 RepID=UPI0015F5364A|nr:MULTISPECIES: aminotransferase class III-fold pyridoxal phosphate-dependent enzyme [unclassified Colwellia]MBA6357146.1 aminotransferase class III-fold pyridoxal phosphate-dependent enzyme [Colwellia sp. BRX8-3]MBA6360902.1 aminotransferase class III-fold pyridoxal phosphate-dependent enzyme [Colwellia sp. BRX8-6]MBA6369168.1 aminotransferase class III-fold pyridoxal phosphate-dependent enzyme [Colwellia sp. BRX8-5]MBA6376070.1 aminotransferase class III-fold pyridoxal phosphate-dependent en
MTKPHKPQSNAMLKRAHENMPLGVADSYRYWGEENTVFLSSMKGCTITDCDQQTFVDFRLAYGPIILGYRDERVDNEVINAITSVGTISGFSTGLDSDVVELVKSLCPNIDKMRFANSGTEAVIGAVRTARGFTKRNKIVVVEGGFHGLHDEVMWKSDVDNWEITDENAPEIIPFGAGIPQSTREHQVSVPLNDFKAIDTVFAEHGHDIAAILIEPIMGNCGSIASTQAYMQKLRDTCDTNGSLLIMDEVKTGFRVAKGGAQALYGIYADLTTYAKAMGNGYPIAAFGGKANVMDAISFAKDGVTHGGTYTANMVALSAAKATLTVLKETDALETIATVGQKIQALLSRVFTKFDIEHCFAGPDAMFGVHFGSEVPQNYRDWKKTNSDLYTQFALNLIDNGVMLEPDSREPWFICEAHQTVDLKWLEQVAEQSMSAAINAQ